MLVDRSELGSLDAVTTAAHIAARSLSAREVVEAAIARTEAAEPTLNAVAAEMFEAAIARTAAQPTGPFGGVPTFVKDLEDEEGVVNGQGSRAYRNHVATRTEPFVREYQATGLVSLGRSATPEFGLDVTCEPLANGPTRNPWNDGHSTGGSSGGAAALVAARVVPIAHGSDAAGSIRIPASHCGLVGLKPTRGRGFEPAVNSRLPVPTLTNGVLTRTVADTAHFLAAIEDRMPSPSLPPVGKVTHPSATRRRIGVFTDSPLGFEVDGDVTAATLRAATHCEASLGHRVEEIACPYDGQLVHDVWNNLGFVAWALRLQTRLRRGADPDQLEPWTHGLADIWKREAWRYPAVVRRLRAASIVSRGLWDRFDLLMCPTLAAPPPRIGEFGPETPFNQRLAAEKRHMPFAPIQNVTGDPAISLPLGVSSAGLPIGVQFAAPPGREADLLSIALELETEGSFRMLT